MPVQGTLELAALDAGGVGQVMLHPHVHPRIICLANNLHQQYCGVSMVSMLDGNSENVAHA